MADQLNILTELLQAFNDTIPLNDSLENEEELLNAVSFLLKNRLSDYLHTDDDDTGPDYNQEHDFPTSYRIVATIIHSVIFLVGVTGNIILIAAARKSRSLRTSTYTYLVSLSFADLLVLLTAVPEAIISHQVGKRWLFGSAGCAVFVFLNFLGINMGSLSIMTFTIERYIAICRPLLAYRVCTVERTKKIIFWGWIIVVLYCCPWFALTEVRTDPSHLDRQQCQFRMSKEQYSAFFIADFAIFYLVPLLTAFVSYVYIGNAVRKRHNTASRGSSVCLSVPLESEQQPLRDYRHSTGAISVSKYRHSARSGSQSQGWPQKQNNSVNRMLIVVVILFAISWLPFRLLLIYNSFVTRSWLDIWFLLFAKSLVYMNCAINPILYNIMSQRFRRAVRQTLFSCWPGTGKLNRRESTLRDRSSTVTIPSIVHFKVDTVVNGKYQDEDSYFIPRVPL